MKIINEEKLNEFDNMGETLIDYFVIMGPKEEKILKLIDELSRNQMYENEEEYKAIKEPLKH